MSKRRPRSNKREHQMAEALDKLAAFDQYCEDILPLLQKAIKEGWTRDQIDNHPKVQALLAARQITIALKEIDSSKAMTAIKDHRDRTQGKPKETKEIEHRYSKLKEEELDSLILSELGELAGSDDAEDLPN
jgi:hypothetical protein